ncbi:cytochrome P450 [Antribacter gilvus]|uniref:cytochrome P450 n=1 Tax=Antribacter gilvus TaxID=2304675 RepID=UPI0013DF66F0|nr:cytochrome P450 [Antribacter gilvus]
MASTYRERLEDIPDRVSLTGLTGADDPQEMLDKLRAIWGPVAPVDLEPGVPAWLVLDHREILTVLRNEQVFSRSSRSWRYLTERRLTPGSPLLSRLAPQENAHHLDGAEQRRLREALDDALGALDEAVLARTVAVTVDAVLDQVARHGTADLVDDFAVPVTVMILGELFGLSLVDAQRMHELVDAKHRPFDEGRAAAADQLLLLIEHVAARAAEPGDDLTTALVQHPHHTNDFEVQAAVVLAFDIAHDAEIAWITSTLHRLLTDPHFAGRVHGGRLDVADALEEAARVRPPLANLQPRYARESTELGGRHIAAGDAVVPSVLGAGTDHEVGGTPDEPLVTSGRFPLMWGAGLHGCPAQRTGSLIGRVVVERVLHRLPGLTLAVDAKDVELRSSPWASYPARLPVSWTPSP